MARDRLDEEERQVAEQHREIETRLAQIAEDLAREGTLAEDAENAVSKIAEQRRELSEAAEKSADAEHSAEAAHAASAAEVAAFEERARRREPQFVEFVVDRGFFFDV